MRLPLKHLQSCTHRPYVARLHIGAGRVDFTNRACALFSAVCFQNVHTFIVTQVLGYSTLQKLDCALRDPGRSPATPGLSLVPGGHVHKVYNAIIGGSCHKYHFCEQSHENTSFVATKVCLPPRFTFVNFVATKYISHDKYVFIATEVLSRQA